MEKTRIVVRKGQKSTALVREAKDSSQRATYPIRREVTRIGRSPSNDIVINDSTVSEYHAAIRFEDDGYYIYDFASTNGTRVNGLKVYRKRIVDGDLIQVGQSIFAVISKNISLSFTTQG